MAKGFIIESRIAATNVDAYNRDCVCVDTDFDGGNLISLAHPTAQGSDVWTADTPATGSLGGLWIAYNPALHINKIGNNEFAGLTKDVREFTNVQGRVFSAFKPQVGDVFILSKECVASADAASVVADDYLEAKNGQSTWGRKTSSPTSGSTAVKVMKKIVIPFPAQKGHVGISKQDAFEVECVQA